MLCSGLKIKMESEKIKELNIQGLQEDVGQNQSSA